MTDAELIEIATGMREGIVGEGSSAWKCAVSPSDVPRWFVVKSKPRCEAEAATGLALKGYDVFYPLIRKECRHPRTKKRRVLEFPMFPCYMFIKYMGEPPAGEIRKVDGVSHVIHNRGKAVPVNGADVERARQAQAEGCFDITLDMADVKIGQRVRVLDGPATGFSGMVVNVRGRKHVRVLLDALREVTMSVENLEPAW